MQTPYRDGTTQVIFGPEEFMAHIPEPAEACRQCSGRLRVITSIEAPAIIGRILEHLGRDAGSLDPAYPSRAPVPQIAAQIIGCSGRSGSIRDYVLQLVGALREFGVSDSHVSELENLVLWRLPAVPRLIPFGMLTVCFRSETLLQSDIPARKSRADCKQSVS